MNHPAPYMYIARIQSSSKVKKLPYQSRLLSAIPGQCSTCRQKQQLRVQILPNIYWSDILYPELCMTKRLREEFLVLAYNVKTGDK